MEKIRQPKNKAAAFPYPHKQRFFLISPYIGATYPVTTAFFLNFTKKSAVRLITKSSKTGPAAKENTDTARLSTLVGSKAVTSRNFSSRSMDRIKFSRMEYINGPVRITKIFLQYIARTKPKVIIIIPSRPLQQERTPAYNNGVWTNAPSKICPDNPEEKGTTGGFT